MLEERAIDDASQALARDENLGHAWLARATLSRVSFHWKTAEEGFSRALALAPNDSDVLGDYGNFKAEIGECDDAMMLSQRNVEINPNGVLPYAWLVITAHKCHEYEVALEAAERLGELMPGSPFAFNTIGLAHIPLGNSVEAARYLRTAEQLATDDFVILLAGQIYAYGLLGLDDDARRVYERFLPLTDKIDVGAGEWIFTYLGIGDIDSAHEWLERALTKVENGERDAGYISFMIAVRNVHNDPILEQPRFRELFDKIEAIARSR
jgi:tetratricopeptide (TPR) repeat protein